MKIDKRKFLETYTVEVQGYLTSLNQGLVSLEKESGNQNLLEELFRLAHTLKGASRMMGFGRISNIAHKIEDLFGLLKSKKLVFKSYLADPLFQALDVIEKALPRLADESDNAVPADFVIQNIEAACAGTASTGTAVPKEIKTIENISSPPETMIEKPKGDSPKGDAPKGDSPKEEYLKIPISRINHLLNLIGEMVISKVRSSYKMRLMKKVSRQSLLAEKMLYELENLIKEAKLIPDELLQFQGTVIRASQEMESAAHLLNHLHTTESLFGTLRKELAEVHDDIQTEVFHLNPVIEELQQKMKEMRMLPCATLFEGFPRLVRDIARQQEKEVELTLRGGETELDKKVLEAIKGPLIHILRNAVDHGIESKEERRKLGKKEAGKITLGAYQEGDRVVLLVEDDGHGIDIEKVRQTALEKNIIGENDLADMTPQEVMNLVFAPGFSTAPIITDVSGRGVGLDVVRTELERLKGAVVLSSQVGLGTSLRIDLPLTIAIMSVLLIEAGGFRWALPMSNLLESLRVFSSEISTIENRMIIQVRGHSVPILSLTDLLGVKMARSNNDSSPLTNEKVLTVVIINSLNKQVGFIVDKVLGEEEVFIKNIGAHLGKVQAVSGASILATGDVIVILDTQDLATQSLLAHPVLKIKEKGKYKTLKKKILIVEDSLTTRELEKSILENSGYEVETAIDGLDALEKLSFTSFDAIVSDIQMPRMDGFEFCKTLKQNDRLKSIPVIFVTALSREDEKRKGIQVGAVAYITKGQFDQGNLLETLERIT